MTRTFEYEQDGIKGKWESSSAREYWLKCHGQFNWLHPKTLSREERYKSRKIRETFNLVKTNTWIPLLRNIEILKAQCGTKEAIAV